jgi:hypothetical protein
MLPLSHCPSLNDAAPLSLMLLQVAWDCDEPSWVTHADFEAYTHESIPTTIAGALLDSLSPYSRVLFSLSILTRYARTLEFPRYARTMLSHYARTGLSLLICRSQCSHSFACPCRALGVFSLLCSHSLICCRLEVGSSGRQANTGGLERRLQLSVWARP